MNSPVSDIWKFKKLNYKRPLVTELIASGVNQGVWRSTDLQIEKWKFNDLKNASIPYTSL